MKERLSTKERQQLCRLTQLCNEHDGTHYTPSDEADGYFLSRHGDELVSALCVYRLGETRLGKDVEQLVLLTQPQFRRKGRMRRLLAKYQKSTEDRILRYDVYPCEAAESYLKHIGAVHAYDECMLILKLTDKIPASGAAKEIPATNLETAISVTASEAEDGTKELEVRNRYSQCGVRIYGKEGFLHSVRTDQGHLRQGSAQAMLTALMEKLRSDCGLSSLALCVSSENKAAVGLYQKLGFREKERIQVWYSR